MKMFLSQTSRKWPFLVSCELEYVPTMHIYAHMWSLPWWVDGLFIDSCTGECQTWLSLNLWKFPWLKFCLPGDSAPATSIWLNPLNSVNPKAFSMLCTWPTYLFPNLSPVFLVSLSFDPCYVYSLETLTNA